MIRRLDDLALEKYLELIELHALADSNETRIAAVESTIQKICSNFPLNKVRGLAAIVVATIYTHSVQLSDWDTMKKVLEKSLHYLETLEKKAGAVNTENSSMSLNIDLEITKLVIDDNRLIIVTNCSEYINVFHKFMTEILAEKGETVRPIEKMVCALSLLNLKAACVRIDSYSKEILSKPDASRAHSLTNEVVKTIDELQPGAEQLKTIQEIQTTIKRYLDTGPYNTWEEIQSGFIQHLVQQPVLHLYANKLAKALISSYFRKYSRKHSLKRQKMLIAACLHPAVTRLDATAIPTGILQEVLPKLKDLRALAIVVRVDKNQFVYTDYVDIISCLAKSCSKLRSVHISIRGWPDPKGSRVPGILLEELLTVLPTTLTSLSLELPKGFLRSLDKMAQSGRFCSLKKIILHYVHCKEALHESFSNLTSVAVLRSPMSNHLLNNIGGWLKEISLIHVNRIDIGKLANNLPALEILKAYKCKFSAPFVAGPIPTFKSLKTVHFVKSKFSNNERLAHINNNCLWCILRNSAEIENVIIAKCSATSGRCFQKLMKSNQMVKLQVFELYQYGSTFQGLITADLAVQVVKAHPYLSWVGGIDCPATQSNLSKMYPDKTFTCLSERAKKYMEKTDLDNVFFVYGYGRGHGRDSDNDSDSSSTSQSDSSLISQQDSSLTSESDSSLASQSDSSSTPSMDFADWY